MEKQINKKIVEIVHSVNNTIPVVWDNLFINISLSTDGGSVYYFFNEEGNDEYIYSLYIPTRYGISNGDFRQDERRTFDLAWDLRDLFKKSGQPLWTNCVIKVLGTKMFTEFDYTPWVESEFGPSSRLQYFKYRYLGFSPSDEKELSEFKAMEAFQKKYNNKG